MVPAAPTATRENALMRRLLLGAATLSCSALLMAAALPGPALAHGEAAPIPAFPGVLLAWSLDPIPILGVLAATVLYLAVERRITRGHPAQPVPRLRRWLFLGGMAALLVALVSPIDTYEGSLFSVHMVQHMLLELVAAPLIILSAPITLALRALSPRGRHRLLAALHSFPLRWLAFPIVTWFLFAGVNWWWHFSSWYEVALDNSLVHYAEHACFLGAALLFWLPAIGPDPQPWRVPHPVRILYLFLAMPQNSFLGVALLSTTAPLYVHYVDIVRSWGPTPLDDQHLGGVVMWVFGDFAFLAAMIGVVAAWMRFEDRRTARLDARLDEETRRAAVDPDVSRR